MPSERVQRRIDRLLDQAEEALDKREWAVVNEIARSVLNIDPENSDAKSFLGLAEPHVGTAQRTVASTESAPSKPAENSSPNQPTSFASGRYTVSKFLGEGGKKKVYLAHDNTLDRDVAFALVKTEGLDETSRERVKREAQAMGRMGTHPSIMPIYDLGEENGQPFMVQPLMGGGDVEGLVEEADGPLALERAIEIATQTAQGLSFAHSKGIVHRDLKPSNVWLDEDGAAKIGDFGLAVAADRSRLTVEKVMVGTVSYMPPEQATGGEVTPQADLYSLGAMLYEMSTGRVPFMGDDDIGVISQHINTPPVAPSWHNSKIPKTLDSLILRLLAKDPSERPSDANEVLVALKSVDLTAVEEREEGSKDSLDSMAGGVFVGRHREMDQLKAIFEDVLSGKGRMVTLVGEPGIGKTRTAQELATYAGMREAEVLWGRSYESGGAPPYWPWVQVIRSHVAGTEPQELREQLGATAPVIAEVVSDIKAKLPDIPAPIQIEDPESARFRLFDSISTFLRQISSSTPLVLMLEDLHWSDKPSLMLLEFVARELANSRILIVGNYRDMELNRRHPLSVTLGDLSRERLFERVVLRGLQKHDVQRFIEIAAGISPPSALVDAVHTQTEGNPLFVTETVRLLIQEGDITSGQSSKGGTTSWEIRIPEGVREVIGRRLDRLSERCNEVLTIAAVIGRQFRFDVLKMLAEDTTENQLLDAMDESLSARIIEELPDEVGFYQFTHASIQETLTSELSANRLVRAHARIAEALEDYYGDEAEANAAELVEHFAEAETVLGTEKIIKYSIAAGEEALEAYSTSTALNHFQRCTDAFAGTAPTELRARAYLGLGRAQAAALGVNKSQTTFETLRIAFDSYVQLGHTDEAVKVALVPLGLAVLITGASDMIDQAIEFVKPRSEGHGRLLAKAARHYRIERDYDEGLRTAKLAIEIGEELGDNRILTEAYYSRAALNSFMGEHEIYLQSLDDALKSTTLADERGDTYYQLRARIAQMIAIASLGRVAEAVRSGREAAVLANRIGEKTWGDIPTRWANIAEFCMGNFDAPKQPVPDNINSDTEFTPVLFSLRADAEQGLPVNESRIHDALNGMARRLRRGDAGLGLVSGAQLLALVGDGHLESLRIAQAREEARTDRTVGPYTEIGIYITSAMIAIFESDIEQARVRYDGLLPYRLTNWQATLVDRVLGNLARVLNEPEAAVGHFEDALSVARDGGHRVGLAYACADYSDLLLDRNAPGDREKAIELQDEAIAIATELGMKPLLERVLAKREILKA